MCKVSMKSGEAWPRKINLNMKDEWTDKCGQIDGEQNESPPD